MPGLLSHPQYLDRVRDGAARFADVVGSAELGAPVGACPGWSVRDLAWHLGGVHRWATVALRENRAGEETHAGPTEAGPLAGWLREGAAGLLEALAGADPQAPCWNFGPPPRLAGFWFRRQALETAVHLWDARTAVGPESEPDAGPDDELAADGVDEVVSMMFPRQVRLGRCAPLATSLGLQATGSGLRWVLAADGLPGEATARDAPAAATVSGPPARLFLLLWKRIGPDDPSLTLDGDAAAVRSVLAQPLVP